MPLSPISSRRAVLARALQLAAGATLLAGTPALVHAQASGRPLRLVYPGNPGTPVDPFLRLMLLRLQEALGQPTYMDYKPGAAGIVGVSNAKASAPDGQTLLFASSSWLVISALLQKKPPYDPVRDFVPVTTLVRYPFYLVAHKDVPARSVAELVALAKARPGKLTIGSIGQGSGNHLMAELFKAEAGIDLLHVPYKGTAAAITALQTGEIHLLFDSIASAQPHVRSGALRALAISGPERLPQLPDVPTLVEQGYPRLDKSIWWGLLLPAGAAPELAARYNAEIVRILALPELQAQMAANGWQPWTGTPAQFAQHIAREVPVWRELVGRLNLAAE